MNVLRSSAFPLRKIWNESLVKFILSNKMNAQKKKKRMKCGTLLLATLPPKKKNFSILAKHAHKNFPELKLFGLLGGTHNGVIL